MQQYVAQNIFLMKVRQKQTLFVRNASFCCIIIKQKTAPRRIYPAKGLFRFREAQASLEIILI